MFETNRTVILLQLGSIVYRAAFVITSETDRQVEAEMDRENNYNFPALSQDSYKRIPNGHSNSVSVIHYDQLPVWLKTISSFHLSLHQLTRTLQAVKGEH